MLLFLPLSFLSCPKPKAPSKDLSTQQVLEWQISAMDFLTFEPSKFGRGKRILSYWHTDRVDVIAKTPCTDTTSSQVSATITSFSGETLQELNLSPNSFGELSFSFPIHRVKKTNISFSKMRTYFRRSLGHHPHAERNQTPLPQLYSPTKWYAQKKLNLFFGCHRGLYRARLPRTWWSPG